MLETEKFFAASAKELEGLPYYEMISKLGLLSFNTQGNRPIELVAELTNITSSNTVLIVGCGSGGTAVLLAEASGATVLGVDIAAGSVRAAFALASKSPARGRASFLVGDAHALPFRLGSFDVVVTEYMAFFLRQATFNGFFSALKSGGQVALAELMKDPTVDAVADSKILGAEESYSEVLGYRFHIPLVAEYVDYLGKAGFVGVCVSERFKEPGFRDKVRNMGGWKNMLRIVWVTLRLMVTSSDLRNKFLKVGRVKRVLVQNRSTAKYVFQAIVMARKP